MRYCGQCGQPNEDSNSFCTRCGAPLQQNPGNDAGFNSDPVPAPTAFSVNDLNVNGSSAGDTSGGMNGGQTYTPPREEVIYTDVAPRSVAVCIILTIVTCGIYGIYWMYKLNNEINELAQDPTATSGGLVILFTILTCGIFGLYWAYKMGQKCDDIRQMNGNSGILFLILSIFGLGIVAYALMQDCINKVLE